MGPSFLSTREADEGAPNIGLLRWQPVAGPEGKHILIVDDDPNFRRLLKVMLIQSGFPLASIQDAEDSATAVTLCRDRAIDLVFCDLNLTRRRSKSGIGVIYDIRRICPDLPVYMVTADNSADMIERVLLAGATGHLLKPLNLRILKRVLATAFPPRKNPSLTMEAG